ncbi:MAG: aa3-type cytochrome c oxidase subunit IV [Alphaproteobacteria bacterium]|nr:aa3-type cytochrome c oxidase subunit IV [Alphaproteobacteria bacterium]
MAQQQNLDLPHKQQAFATFVKLTQWTIGICIGALVLMAIFLL